MNDLLGGFAVSYVDETHLLLVYISKFDEQERIFHMLYVLYREAFSV